MGVSSAAAWAQRERARAAGGSAAAGGGRSRRAGSLGSLLGNLRKSQDARRSSESPKSPRFGLQQTQNKRPSPLGGGSSVSSSYSNRPPLFLQLEPTGSGPSGATSVQGSPAGRSAGAGAAFTPASAGSAGSFHSNSLAGFATAGSGKESQNAFFSLVELPPGASPVYYSVASSTPPSTSPGTSPNNGSAAGQSTLPPADMMLEIFRALRALRFEWKIVAQYAPDAPPPAAHP